MKIIKILDSELCRTFAIAPSTINGWKQNRIIVYNALRELIALREKHPKSSKDIREGLKLKPEIKEGDKE